MQIINYIEIFLVICNFIVLSYTYKLLIKWVKLSKLNISDELMILFRQKILINSSIPRIFCDIYLAYLVYTNNFRNNILQHIIIFCMIIYYSIYLFLPIRAPKLHKN